MSFITENRETSDKLKEVTIEVETSDARILGIEEQLVNLQTQHSLDR